MILESAPLAGTRMYPWSIDLTQRLSYDRYHEIKEFFLELTDVGGAFIVATHDGLPSNTGIVDKDFRLSSKRIDYTDEPLYKVYLVKIRFNELSSKMENSKDVDEDIKRTIDFFTEIPEALNRLNDFGYKFIIHDAQFTKSRGIIFDIMIYHVDDVIPFEKIFTK